MSTKDIDQHNDKYEKYLEELKNYYNLKKKYTAQKDIIINKIINSDNTLDVKKKLFSKQKFKCIKCGKFGGSIFSETNTSLRVICGSIELPCDLNITITKLNSELLNENLEITKDILDTVKKSIITTKLDFLFNYIEEDKAIEKFESFKIELNNLQETYNKLFIMYKDLTDNTEKNDLLREKLLEQHNMINDYKEYIKLYNSTKENAYLKDAIGLYVSKIVDLNIEIMDIKYKHNSLEINDLELTNTLIQEKYNLNDLELTNTT